MHPHIITIQDRDGFSFCGDGGDILDTIPCVTRLVPIQIGPLFRAKCIRLPLVLLVHYVHYVQGPFLSMYCPSFFSQISYGIYMTFCYHLPRPPTTPTPCYGVSSIYFLLTIKPSIGAVARNLGPLLWFSYL